ncbi:MAG: hypothetical protein WCG27_02195, partial [Pseudomonadota bacterium]
VDVVNAIRVLIVNGKPSADEYEDEVALLRTALRPEGEVFSGQEIVVESGAGDAAGTTLSPAELDNEIQMVKNLEKDRFIFGVSGLKRLVPGWFLKADVGLDIIGVGFGLEF